MPDEEKPSDRPARSEPPISDDVLDAEVIGESPKTEPETPDQRPEPVRERSRSGSLFGAVLGGIIAAGAGFGLAQLVPQGWPLQSESPLVARIDAQEVALAQLSAALDDLSKRPAPDLSEEIAALRDEVEQRLAALPPPVDPTQEIADLRGVVDGALAAFDARLTEVEKLPVGADGNVSATALAAYDRELQSLRAQVEDRLAAGSAASGEIVTAVAAAKAELAATRDEAERLRAEASAAAQAARVTAAIDRLRGALEGGGPFASAVADLADAGIDLPAAIAERADTGVPTLSDLQRSFPQAARAALDAARRSEVGPTWGDRLTTFLRTQTGARSLAPRDGDDADAILSRAEAALRAGDVGLALTEASALPEVAQQALSDWLADATARQAAAAAVAALATSVDTQ